MESTFVDPGFDPFSVVTSLGWLVFGPHFHTAVFANPLISVLIGFGWLMAR